MSSLLRQPPDEISYRPGKGVDDFVQRISAADPMQLVETERRGVSSVFLKDLSKRMEMPTSRLYSICLLYTSPSPRDS